ncbi:nuclear factor of activated T-cells, cytoplasmic 1-like [Thalassophryne amazonica]|uniref:nuclear factor of activated T-cells, cytoplasmic 1-like n=1 Tax=Thalassophryne amazonica TaxID=390379 RepID=UPI0014710447|nr:nuclear factor of activated T-cells, cytoplasmic 1-like [Thalassophryne amazonica]
MLHSPGSPDHLNSQGIHSYHPVYPNSSPSSSPVSHPSTPSGAAESPFVQAYSPSQAQAAASSAQTRGSSPSLLHEDASCASLAITVKQEPQELDQMYLDDVNEIIRNDLSSISVHTHA